MAQLPTNSRVILDPSFVRSTRADGHQIKALADRGNTLIVIDALAYELCTTDNPRQWAATQRKLAVCPDSIECWHHTGSMMRIEVDTHVPFPYPLFEDTTYSIRQMLRSGAISSTAGVEEMVAREKQRREGDVMPILFRAFEDCASISRTLYTAIGGKPIGDAVLADVCFRFVNTTANVLTLANHAEPNLTSSGLDARWVTWHHYRAILAIFCDYLRQNRPSWNDLPEKARKEWTNTKHDLDYLISLARADAIASAETAGAQYHYRRWMYGDSRAFISVRDVE